MADQNITALPVSATPASSDQLLLVGATEEKLIDYDKLADAILNKLTSKNFSLDQGTMPLVSALNQLNSKASRFDGNIKKVGFRSGQRALNNIYLDFYDSNNSRTSLAFTTDGENAIKFLVNDEEKMEGCRKIIFLFPLYDSKLNSKSLLLKFVIPLKIEIGKYININGDSIDYEPYCIIHVPVKTGQKATFTNVSNNENTRHELWNASTNERLSFSNANYNGTYSVDVPSSETNYYVKLSVFKDSGLPRQLQ